jgi:replicative DNA helicase
VAKYCLGMHGESVARSTAGAFGPSVVVPHSVAAEQALVGALLVNNRLLDDLDGALAFEHFYVPLHAEVFRVIADITARGGEANPITVVERLKGTSFDADKQLFPHLSKMFENAALAADVRSLAEVIQVTFMQRQLMGLCDSAKGQAAQAAGPEAVKAVIESAGSELFRLSEIPEGRAVVRGMRDGLIDVLKRAEVAKKDGSGITGVASGYTDLDNLLGGFQRSDLIILGARPSMGKTSLLLNIAERAARKHSRNEPNGAAVAVFSLEMSYEQLVQRMLAGAANVSSQQIGSGRLGEGDFIRMAASANELAGLPLFIDDTPGLSIATLRARARRMKRQHGIGLVIVDYLQLMSGPPVRGDFNKVQEVSAISQGLKQVARELDVPVIAASQLSRQLEQRDNKRPQLSDLRESGSIEQDADVVMMLYRPEYYLSRQIGAAEESAVSDAERKRAAEALGELERVRGITEVLVSKNRKGPTDTVKLLFEGKTTSFADYSARH